MRFASLSIVLLAFFLVACQEPAANSAPASNSSVAVVDVSRLVRDSEPGRAAQTFMEEIQKQFSTKLMTAQEAVQKKPEDQAATEEFQKVYMALQQRLQAEEQNVQSVLTDHIFRVIKAYREKAGLGIIVRAEAAMDFDRSLDCTDALLEMMNKEKIEFRPVTKDEPAPAAAPAAEQAPKAESAPKAEAAPAAEKAPEAAPAK